MSQLDPLPQDAPISRDANGQPLYMDGTWLRYLFNALFVRLNTAAYRLGSVVQLKNQGAAISATPIPLPSLTAGRIRISWYLRVTTADAVSSAVRLTLAWTESTTAQSVQGSNLNGNTTTTLETGTAFLEVDANAAPTYATTYASNTPGAMKYRLSIQVEALP